MCRLNSIFRACPGFSVLLGQVPVNGNALFSAVAMSIWFIESGEHPVASSPEIEAIAKDLRQVRFADGWTLLGFSDLWVLLLHP